MVARLFSVVLHHDEEDACVNQVCLFVCLSVCLFC